MLYVGKAINLKSRVKSYFSGQDEREKVKLLVPRIADIDFIEVISEFESLLVEAELIKKYLPKYNTVAKDDKHPLYIAITKEEFPKVRMIRRSEEIGQAWIFGPFPSSMAVRQVVRFLRRIFPFCTCKHNRGRPCLYAALKLCDPCPRIVMKTAEEEASQLKQKYKQQMRLIKDLLSGKSNLVIEDLERAMKQSVAEENFEQAAYYRDGLTKLRKLLQPRLPVASYLENPQLALEKRKEAVADLGNQLNKAGILPSITYLERIEGYDISTMGGLTSTGAMVVLTDGEPDKRYYRRFKIKVEGRPNDVGMMKEMLSRRFARTEDSKWPLPDLVMVDGGKGQIGAAQEVLNKYGLVIPIVGLAKRQEELYVPVSTSAGQLVKLVIPRHSPALQALQHLRDEAHRFANKYRKKITKL